MALFVIMKVASLNEIKRESQTLEPETLVAPCVRLAKLKKENKELLNFLLFEAEHRHDYINNLKEEIEELFRTVPVGSNVYFVKKSLRKILRFVNRQIKYAGSQEAELEVRVFFCTKMKDYKVPMSGSVIQNLYQQQVKKIETIFKKLPEDLQADYEREVKMVNK